MKNNLLRILWVIAAAALSVALPILAAELNRPTIEDYWVEIYYPENIIRQEDNGAMHRAYLLQPKRDYGSFWTGSSTHLSPSKSTEPYTGDICSMNLEKTVFTPGETINVTIRNDSGAPFRMDAGDYRLEYQLDGQWYTVRPGEYSVGLLFDDLQIIGADESVTISVTPENLRQYAKVALDPETGLYESLDDAPVILRPGRYRFALSIQTDADFDHLAESPEYLVGCEFEVE